ncbi:MAG: chemotaxis protein CheW [Desulfobacterales bacterium]|nr:chemotaxis protein CheW [Desulfobacterales bacterium]
MLLLLFNIGDGRYALTAEQIVEVVPLVKVKEIPLAPDYVAGLMDYHGRPVPVIDLCRLLIKKPCEIMLSSRIILVHYPTTGSRTSTLGLIAGQVTEAVKSDRAEIPPSGVLMDEALYQHHGTESARDKMVQWFDLKKMLPGQEICKLFQ